MGLYCSLTCFLSQIADAESPDIVLGSPVVEIRAYVEDLTGTNQSVVLYGPAPPAIQTVVIIFVEAPGSACRARFVADVSNGRTFTIDCRQLFASTPLDVENALHAGPRAYIEEMIDAADDEVEAAMEGPLEVETIVKVGVVEQTAESMYEPTAPSRCPY